MPPVNWARMFLDEDSRGNRLENAQVKRSGDDLFLDLLCVGDIAEQFFVALGERGRRPSWVEIATTDWTHRIRFDGPYHQWLKDLIDLLQRVLTLRTHPQLDMAIALDFHSIPPDPDHPEKGWTRTGDGDLVYRKYFKREYSESKKRVGRAGTELTNRLVAVIDAHPLYREATRVIVVPSTSNPWRFGELLGRSVAKKAGIQSAMAVCRSPLHQQAKEGHASSAVEPYDIDGDVFGQRVIIVDDLYKSGQTIRDIAIAATRCGAAQVLGLSGTRAWTRK